MRIRNPGTAIENIPYDTRQGHDPQPIEVFPGQTIEIQDTYFDGKSEGSQKAFVALLQTGRLELVEAPVPSEVE